MSKPIYQVANWQDRYENNRTRELKAMAWVPVPNSHDGDGYTVLVCRENGAAYLGAWLAILQVASRCDPRGTLLRDCQKPHDAASIARMTRLPEDIIKATLDVCVNECNWLIISDAREGAGKPQEGAGKPQATDEEGNGMEGNGTEGKNMSGKPDAPPPPKEKPEGYHKDTRTVLHWLNQHSGKAFREVDASLTVISERLKEPGVDLEGVKLMIERQCKLWKNDAKMADYMRPSTLFRRSNFDGYYASRMAGVANSKRTPTKADGEFCPGWQDKDQKDMTDREIVALAGGL